MFSFSTYRPAILQQDAFLFTQAQERGLRKRNKNEASNESSLDTVLSSDLFSYLQTSLPTFRLADLFRLPDSLESEPRGIA